MASDPVDRIPVHNRVSIPAILVREGEDVRSGLAVAGIIDPVTIPVIVSDTPPGGGFGDGISPNPVGVFEGTARQAGSGNVLGKPDARQPVRPFAGARADCDVPPLAPVRRRRL